MTSRRPNCPGQVSTLHEQFSQQVERLVALRYAESLGLSARAFRNVLQALSSKLRDSRHSSLDVKSGALPFVLVVRSPKLPERALLALVARRGRFAVERLFPFALEEIQQSSQANDGDAPGQVAYLLHDIDRGGHTMEVMMESEKPDNRVPLTVAEGIATLTQFPEILLTNHDFKMTGSRFGENRVPTFSLNNGRPELGWCRQNIAQNCVGAATYAKRSELIYFP